MSEDVAKEGQRALVMERRARLRAVETARIMSYVDRILAGSASPTTLRYDTTLYYSDPCQMLSDVILEMRRRLLAPPLPQTGAGVGGGYSFADRATMEGFLVEFLDYAQDSMRTAYEPLLFGKEDMAALAQHYLEQIADE